MQQKDTNLIAQRVSKGCGLTGSGIERDRQIAGMTTRIFSSGKAQYIGGFVFAAKRLVQTAQSSIVSQQNIYIAMQANGFTGTVEKSHQAGLR